MNKSTQLNSSQRDLAIQCSLMEQVEVGTQTCRRVIILREKQQQFPSETDIMQRLDRRDSQDIKTRNRQDHRSFEYFQQSRTLDNPPDQSKYIRSQERETSYQGKIKLNEYEIYSQRAIPFFINYKDSNKKRGCSLHHQPLPSIDKVYDPSRGQIKKKQSPTKTTKLRIIQNNKHRLIKFINGNWNMN